MMHSHFTNHTKEYAPIGVRAQNSLNQKLQASILPKHSQLSSSITQYEAEASIQDQMRRSGLTPQEIIFDGSFHRFHIEGDKRGSQNGWYVANQNPFTCTFGSWKTNIKETWRSTHKPMTPQVDLDQYNKKAQIEHKQKENRRQQDAANEANEIWELADPADPRHPYLIKKGVKPNNLRQSKDRLIVPLYDINRKIWSLQYIFENGEKRFLKGGRTKGLFAPIGNFDAPSKPSQLFICEGWATGASLYEHLGDSVLCAMNAGNLLEVAKAARTKWAGNIVIAGDDDRHTQGNPGRTKANEAALAIGAEVAFPEFQDSNGTDFNDFFSGAQNGK